MKSDYCLLAGLLPGNLSAREAGVQTHLFRSAGSTAALALPPLVPLAWVPEAIDVATIAEDVVPRRPTIGDYRCENRLVVRNVTWASGSQRVLSQSLQVTSTGALFPADDVVVVATGVDCSAVGEVLAMSGSGRRWTAKVYRLVCMFVEWHTESDRLRSARYQVLSERWVR